MMDVVVKQRLVDAADGLARAAGAGRADALLGVLRVADELQAVALGLLADEECREALVRGSGLSAELGVALGARRMGWEARDLVATSDALRGLPRTAGLLAEGVVTSGQMRAIARAIRVIGVSDRARVDELVARRAPRLVSVEPERLVEEVEDLVWRLREDLLVAREERQVDASFLALQQRFDGGGRLYGEADVEAFATIAAAVDAAAERPAADDDDDGRSRARQRMDALVRVCETSLAGGGAQRARPRFLAVLDVADDATADGARVLAQVAGRPLRLSNVATQTLLCDAEITPIVFHEGSPVGVGNTTATIPEKLRAAVIARDGACRSPGCRMPAAWSDVHHIRARADGGDARVENLLLLCRRCHRRVHRYRWRIAIDGDRISFQHRGETHTTHPRARPARE